jgi:hypothetical protein
MRHRVFLASRDAIDHDGTMRRESEQPRETCRTRAVNLR